MKSGELAAALGITPDTVKNWAKHPALEKFFSEGAKGEDGSFQRTFNESDVLVIATIHHLRTSGTTEWDEIAQHIEDGVRYQEFPQNAIAADPRTIPIQQAEQSAKAAATLAERDAALRRVNELELHIVSLETQHRDEIERLRAESKEESDKIRREYEDRVDKLHQEVRQLLREIGRLEGRLETRDTNATE
jgi:DNA-binding transcriptional MerR regulator